MQNPNKTVHELDDSYKGRKGIEEMIDRIMNTTEDGEPENSNNNLNEKTTA